MTYTLGTASSRRARDRQEGALRFLRRQRDQGAAGSRFTCSTCHERRCPRSQAPVSAQGRFAALLFDGHSTKSERTIVIGKELGRTRRPSRTPWKWTRGASWTATEPAAASHGGGGVPRSSLKQRAEGPTTEAGYGAGMADEQLGAIGRCHLCKRTFGFTPATCPAGGRAGAGV
jgi:hypothetical protein